MTHNEHERRFELFGTEVRLLVGSPAKPGLKPPQMAAMEIEAFLRAFQRKLSRFEPGSELSAFNSERAAQCSVSPLLALALRAGLWAAAQTDGLVDPTLVAELEHAGYARSRAGVTPASLADAIDWAPQARPAKPNPRSRWREFSVDRASGIVRRPAGARFDTGGSGKGLAADLASGRLEGYATHVVDCGGDLRIGGTDPPPRVVEVEHPLAAGSALTFELAAGAVATSGLATRVWKQGDGFAHHLIDPSTGEPAWTGVIQATALGHTTLQAETLAKAALLSGYERGRELLVEHGGALIADNGQLEVVGPLEHLVRAAGDTQPLTAAR